MMFKNSLLFSWRKLVRNKLYTIINVSSLTIGLTSCLVIWLVTHFEFKFDRFHTDRDLIYRVVTYEQYTSDTSPQLVPAVVPPLPLSMTSQLGGIEVCAPYHLLGPIKVEVPNVKSHDQFETSTAIIASPEYFEVMSYRWLAGSFETALAEPNAVILTESKMKYYFGDDDLSSIIGRELVYDDSIHVTVRGIVQDWQENTDFPFTEFISMSTADHGYLRSALQLDQWKGTPLTSRVLLKLEPTANPANIQEGLDRLFKEKWQSNMMVRSELQPLRDVHFSNGESSSKQLSTIYTLLGVALFILILAITNYINLSTAQFLSRNKEVAIRKTMGSGQRVLVLQFLSETLILSIIAVIASCAVVNPLILMFSEFIPQGVQLELDDLDTLLFLGCTIAFTTLAAGMYPAWSFASFKSTAAFQKISTSNTSGTSLRKIMIVAQFTISLIFIISSIFIGRQIDYMLTSDRGFNSDAIIVFSTNDRAHMDRVKLLQATISQLPGVVAAARQNMPPMGLDKGYTGLEFTAASPEPIQVAMIKADENYVPLYEIKIIAGRNMTSSDTLKEAMINETLSKLLGFQKPEDALGQIVGVWGKRIPIVGVVSDFHQADFRQSILPQIITGLECADLAVKLDTRNKSAKYTAGLISMIEGEWRKMYPDVPFEHRLLDDNLASLYQREQTMSWLANIATGIAIFVSCIGLFGLTLYSVEQRTREVGIRKVLGASATQIIALFGKDFLILVLVAFVIACPLAWYAMQAWLQNFAYRLPLNWWVFLLGGMVCVSIAALTVTLLSFKTAFENPIKALRTE